MAARAPVTPNRRGSRSREAVLDAAQRLMAEQGYEAATVAHLVEEAGVPASSIYHYFGSKEGVLLAVMERGAEGFLETLPQADSLVGSRNEHLDLIVSSIAQGLQQRPDFLRLILVMATQPRSTRNGEVEQVVERVRELALSRLRRQMSIVFGVGPRTRTADQLARFALAAIEGAFVATQADPQLSLAGLLEHLPAALVAVHAELRR
jgi:AcrR family transcriptional regulator